jgi:hypothetical protein
MTAPTDCRRRQDSISVSVEAESTYQALDPLRATVWGRFRKQTGSLTILRLSLVPP